MKIIILFCLTILFFSFCKKKNVTPDFSNLIIGKWSCNSYKKDGIDTITYSRPFFLSLFYEYGWEFFQNKEIRFKNGLGWEVKAAENVAYVLTENKTLTINIFDPQLSTYTKMGYEIIELTANKLTIHSSYWKNTFYLLRE